MARRRQFPGGLRAQLLLGLCLMLLGTFALVLVTVENVLARQIREAGLSEARAAASVAGGALQNGLEPSDLLDETVVAVSVDEACVGERCALITSEGADSLRRDGERWFGVIEAAEARFVVEVPGLEERQRRARGFLWPFFLIDAIFVLALAYAFFTFIVMRPLRAIGVAAIRASEGDFASPITRIPRNEFGEVGRSFNEMLRRIDEGREALESKIEEVQRANARIAATQASLVRSEKLASVGHLAAGVAHEVGNPLAALSGYVELLQIDELDDEERRDVLDRCTRQLDRIRGIIRNLLDYSRAEKAVERHDTDLRAVVDDALALVEAIPKARDKSFEVQGDAVANTYAGHLVQVLVNLLVNALDAMGTGAGTVDVTLETDGEVAVIGVTDDGPGIAVDELERIFEPFYTTKEVGEGTGLGLSICQRLIEDLDGTLTVESELGVGTRFEIRLPARSADG